MKGASGKRIVFIGAGNMGEALVKGLLANMVCTPDNVTVADVSEERLDYFRRTFGVQVERDNARAAAEAGVCILAVKPQVMGEVLASLRGQLPAYALVVSIMAGKRTTSIEDGLGERPRVVRVMPNTPALVGAGASAICAGRWASEGDLSLTESLFRSVGIVVRVKEEDMDAVTAVSGSGPAYIFLVMEAMREAAKQLKLDETAARALITATIEGSARLASATGETPKVLRERVTSKGGTTAAALDVLVARGFFDTLVDAIKAAHARSVELSKG